MRVLFFLFTFALSIKSWGVDSKCEAWFKNGKIDRKSKKCVLKCSVLQVDMDTFACPLECEKLCDDPCKESERFWKNKLKDGRPNLWPNTTEKSKQWSEKEKELVTKALSKMPKVLKFELVELYRMDKSKDFPNPSSHGSHYITLYDSAFDSGNDLLRILFHELAHELYGTFSQEDIKSYYISAMWSQERKEREPSTMRSDSTFVRSDGRTSPEEDFANNMEFYLFNPVQLKKHWSPVFEWIKKVYSGKLTLECK